jgi:hypothetical protein
VKLHSVFLRNGCVLPTPLDPLRSPFGEQWMLVEQIPASVLDTMIRQAGWHFIWMSGSCSRRGFAHTQDKAIERALDRALGAVSGQSNAVDFESVEVTKYPGFHVANVTVQRRRIQQKSVLETDDQKLPQAIPVRLRG